MTASQPAAQHLRAIFNGDRTEPHEGSGSSHHVSNRNLLASVAVAAVLLIVLIGLLAL